MKHEFLWLAVLSATLAAGCSGEDEQSTRLPQSNASAGQSAGGAGGLGGGGSAGAASGGSAGLTAGGTGGSAGAAGSAGGGGTGGSMRTPAENLYLIKCASCHGVQGAGIPASADDPKPLGPELQHPIRDYSEWVVRNGLTAGDVFKDPMEAIDLVDDPADLTDVFVSDAELQMIFDYLGTPPQPTTAEGLYLDYCGNCHGADGKGGPTTRDVTTADALTTFNDVVRAGTHPGEYGLRNEFMPAFDQTILTDAELLLIHDYVANTLTP